MLRLDKVIKPWKEAAALNDHINLYGFWNETTFLNQERRSGHGSQRARRGLREPRPCSAGVCGKATGSSPQSFRSRASTSTSTSSNRIAPTYRSPTTTTRSWRLPSSSGGSSLKPRRTTCTRLRSSMPSCSRDHGRRPASAPLLPSCFEIRPAAIGELRRSSRTTHESVAALAHRAGLGAAGPASEDLHPPARRPHAH